MIVDYALYNSLIDKIEDLEDRLSVFEAEAESPDMFSAWEKVQAEAGILSEGKSKRRG